MKTRCLCGQEITDTNGWRTVHMTAHVRRGHARQVKDITEKDGKIVSVISKFEWLVKKPKMITGTHPRRKP